MEWSAGNISKTRELFSEGSKLPQRLSHPPLLDAWSRFEAQQGDTELARELDRKYNEVLNKPRGKRPQESETLSIDGTGSKDGKDVAQDDGRLLSEEF
ncbi:MAG: hypothetical protein MI717_09485 [Spirochaetales bacterium]|nr:hypothetical protein [Spirochaetales bacterium]